MVRSPRNLDDQKTDIEASIAETLQQRLRHGSEPTMTETSAAFVLSDQTTPLRSADHLVNACNATAADVERTGEAVVQMANNIAAEAQALAELLRKHGTAIGARIEEFTAVSERVADKVHAAHADALGLSGMAISLAPQADQRNRK